MRIADRLERTTMMQSLGFDEKFQPQIPRASARSTYQTKGFDVRTPNLTLYKQRTALPSLASWLKTFGGLMMIGPGGNQLCMAINYVLRACAIASLESLGPWDYAR